MCCLCAHACACMRACVRAQLCVHVCDDSNYRYLMLYQIMCVFVCCMSRVQVCVCVCTKLHNCTHMHARN